jgi:pimeloyl-ACP methyl ester carboxylesterase
VPTLDEVILDPDTDEYIRPDELGYDFAEFLLPVADSRSVSVWHVVTTDPPRKGILVILPGSDGNQGKYAQGLPLFIPNGYDVVLFDYEGYGQSPGTRSLEHVIDDAFAVLEYALGEDAIVFGLAGSLGTPALARAATELPLAGCIFDSTLVLDREVPLWLEDANLALPIFVFFGQLYVLPQVPDDYYILDWIPLVEEPKLFIHSRDDTVTPFAGAVEAYMAATEPKEFWITFGDHGDASKVAPIEYAVRTVGWMDKILYGPDTPIDVDIQAILDYLASEEE